LPVDLAAGRCYLPVSDPFDRTRLLACHARWLERASGWVSQGRDYATALPLRRLRAASLLPSLLATATLERLRDSLREAPREGRLTRARIADDMTALENVSHDREVVGFAVSRQAVSRLWDVCQVPEYRKISNQNHAELGATLNKFLKGPAERIPQDRRDDEVRHVKAVRFGANGIDLAIHLLQEKIELAPARLRRIGQGLPVCQVRAEARLLLADVHDSGEHGPVTDVERGNSEVVFVRYVEDGLAGVEHFWFLLFDGWMSYGRRGAAVNS